MKAPVYHGPGQRSWDSVGDPTVSDPTDIAASIAEKQQEVKWGEKRTFSFARRQPEAPSSPHRECRHEDCSRTGTTPFDLYCRTEGPEVAHFMPFGITSRAQAAGAGVVCLVIGALVLLSAAAPSRSRSTCSPEWSALFCSCYPCACSPHRNRWRSEDGPSCSQSLPYGATDPSQGTPSN